MAESALHSDGLFAALKRLDRILQRAVSTADAMYGSAAASDPYRGLYVAPEDVQRILAREPGEPLAGGAEQEQPVSFAELTRLAEMFGLSEFDQDALVVALAPEIDSRYERLYAYLQDDVTKKTPTVELILNLLCDSREAKVAARTRFAVSAPLVENRLVQLLPDPNVNQPATMSHFVRLDDTVVRYLLGQLTLDARLQGCCRLVLPDSESRSSLAESGLTRVEAVARERRENGEPLRLYFRGLRSGPKMVAAQTLAAWLPAPLLIVDTQQLTAGDYDAIAGVIFAEATLHDAVIYFEGSETLNDSQSHGAWRTLQARLLQHTGITILEGRGSWTNQSVSTVTVVFPETSYAERRRTWAREISSSHIEIDSEQTGELASRYRLDPGEIRTAVSTAASQALVEGRPASAEDLFEAAREQCRRDFGPMAQRIKPAATWQDLILAPEQREQLKEIVDQARYRRVVYEQWGFEKKLSQGKGLTALFSGAPGTGKTMAAEVIASELRLDLYRIDLSQIVSKYIGETEKNLARIFEQAGAGTCVLFFDECDALFGKRTEVKDAHDRYANIEVAYLLQRIDDYEGLCILATNLKQNLDPAFARRIRFIVNIEFPDLASRRAIWEKIWPGDLPLAEDVNPDVLARQFRLAGGSIRNVALSAAFLAAAERAPAVGMSHIHRAAQRELEKTGRRAVPIELTDAKEVARS